MWIAGRIISSGTADYNSTNHFIQHYPCKWGWSNTNTLAQNNNLHNSDLRLRVREPELIFHKTTCCIRLQAYEIETQPHFAYIYNHLAPISLIHAYPLLIIKGEQTWLSALPLHFIIVFTTMTRTPAYRCSHANIFPIWLRRFEPTLPSPNWGISHPPTDSSHRLQPQ